MSPFEKGLPRPACILTVPLVDSLYAKVTPTSPSLTKRSTVAFFDEGEKRKSSLKRVSSSLARWKIFLKWF
jgi:hypothetical protein